MTTITMVRQTLLLYQYIVDTELKGDQAGKDKIDNM